MFTLFRAFLFAYGGVEAAKVVHKKLLTSILKAPIGFFDTTPVSNTINVFSDKKLNLSLSTQAFAMHLFLLYILLLCTIPKLTDTSK